MKTMTFQVCDELYAAFEQMSLKLGRPIEEIALDWLAKHPRLLPAQPASGDAKPTPLCLRRHFGAVQSGNRRSADNDSIDADLAREIGASDEGGA